MEAVLTKVQSYYLGTPPPVQSYLRFYPLFSLFCPMQYVTKHWLLDLMVLGTHTVNGRYFHSLRVLHENEKEHSKYESTHINLLMLADI